MTDIETIRRGQHLLARKRFALDGSESVVFTKRKMIVFPVMKTELVADIDFAQDWPPLLGAVAIETSAGFGGYMGYSQQYNVLVIRDLP